MNIEEGAHGPTGWTILKLGTVRPFLKHSARSIVKLIFVGPLGDPKGMDGTCRSWVADPIQSHEGHQYLRVSDLVKL